MSRAMPRMLVAVVAWVAVAAALEDTFNPQDCRCWAAQGQCASNSAFMLESCAASCDREAKCEQGAQGSTAAGGAEDQSPRIAKLEEDLKQKDAAASSTASRIAELEGQIQQKDAAIASAQESATSTATRITALEEQLKQKDAAAQGASGAQEAAAAAAARIADLEAQLQQKDAALQEASTAVARVAELESQLKQKDAAIQDAATASATAVEAERRQCTEGADAKVAALEAQLKEEQESHEARVKELAESLQQQGSGQQDAVTSATARVVELENQLKQKEAAAQEAATASAAAIEAERQQCTEKADTKAAALEEQLKEAQDSQAAAAVATARVAELEEQVKKLEAAGQASSVTASATATADCSSVEAQLKLARDEATAFQSEQASRIQTLEADLERAKQTVQGTQAETAPEDATKQCDEKTLALQEQLRGMESKVMALESGSACPSEAAGDVGGRRRWVEGATRSLADLLEGTARAGDLAAESAAPHLERARSAAELTLGPHLEALRPHLDRVATWAAPHVENARAASEDALRPHAEKVAVARNTVESHGAALAAAARVGCPKSVLALWLLLIAFCLVSVWLLRRSLGVGHFFMFRLPRRVLSSCFKSKGCVAEQRGATRASMIGRGDGPVATGKTCTADGTAAPFAAQEAQDDDGEPQREPPPAAALAGEAGDASNEPAGSLPAPPRPPPLPQMSGAGGGRLAAAGFSVPGKEDSARSGGLPPPPPPPAPAPAGSAGLGRSGWVQAQAAGINGAIANGQAPALPDAPAVRRIEDRLERIEDRLVILQSVSRKIDLLATGGGTRAPSPPATPATNGHGRTDASAVTSPARLGAMTPGADGLATRSSFDV